MGARQTACPDCGGMTVVARVPGRPGAAVRLEPFPDRDGDVRVAVLRRDLLLLGRDDPARGVRYERHQCGPTGVRAPQHRPNQLDLFGS